MLIFGLAFQSSCNSREDRPAPKLIVLIGIDQLRSGYMERYDEVFTGGFRRLLDKGRRYNRAIVDHAATLSYSGHTTLSTGAHPKTHGINTNAWLEKHPDGNYVRRLVMFDTTTSILGYPALVGISPRNIAVTGLADWVRANDPAARAVALSTGPALAVCYGGQALDDQARNNVYWLSPSMGEFVTSAYYRDAYPDWINEFNQQELPAFQESRVWHNIVPERYRKLARHDAAPYEGDQIHTTFPHRFSSSSEVQASQDPSGKPDWELLMEYHRWLANGPFADEALFALAEKAVIALSLGQRNTTDYLALAIKSPDRTGHDYGPRSQEQLDILYRLDQHLGSLLDLLDELVGEDKYIIAISSDHGSPNIPEYEMAQGRPGRRISQQDIQDVLDDIDGFVNQYEGSDEDLTDQIAQRLERVDFIARAMTPAELGGTGPADEILRAFRNSYIPGRNTPYPLWTQEVIYGIVGANHPANWGIQVEYVENAQFWTARSTHGSSYRYDREVPIIFMGHGVKPGIDTGPARTIDVAPTLAILAGISIPSFVDGSELIGP